MDELFSLDMLGAFMTHPVEKDFVVFHRHPGQSNMLIINATAGQFKH